MNKKNTESEKSQEFLKGKKFKEKSTKSTIIKILLFYVSVSIISIKIYQIKKMEKSFKKIKRYINEEKIKHNILNYNERTKYLRNLNRTYDEENLQTFQDKLNYLTIYDSTYKKGKLADKIYLRHYSNEKLGKDICPKIYGVYSNYLSIKLDNLPNKFVIKSSYGKFQFIVKDKKKIDEKLLKSLTNKYLDSDVNPTQFYYEYVKKQLYAEEYISPNSEGYFEGYKIYCFHGVPKFIHYRKEINNKVYYKFFDSKWSQLKYQYEKINHVHINENVQKPKNFDLMMEVATKLSKDFIFVRVDLFDVNEEIKLSKLSFTPDDSQVDFKDFTDNVEIGKYINLDMKLAKETIFNI